MSETPKVVVTGRGPNLCYGVAVEVGGKVIEKEGPIALCSCGLSSTKPFCDGSHKALDESTTPAPADDDIIE